MRVGLVLSGGGARAAMHLGVIQALEDHGIAIDLIAGTSAGAVAGALYARGYSPSECLEILTGLSLFRSVRLNLGGKGLLRLSAMEKFLVKYFPNNDFSDLRIPLIVTATDVVAAETVAYRSGPLIQPVLASCCLPGLFEPYNLDGRQLVDGGVLNNLPVEFVEEGTDFIIGSHCNPFQLDRPLKGSIDVAYRSLLLAVHHQILRRFGKCQLLIEPPRLSRYSIFDFRKMKDIYAIGYDYTQVVLQTAEIPAGKRLPL